MHMQQIKKKKKNKCKSLFKINFIRNIRKLIRPVPVIRKI